LKLQKNTMLALCGVLEFAAQPGRQLSAAEIAGKYGARRTTSPRCSAGSGARAL
jgi:hypothetical protein